MFFLFLKSKKKKKKGKKMGVTGLVFPQNREIYICFCDLGFKNRHRAWVF